MEDKLQTLYNNLVKEGYDLPEYNTFKVDMTDPAKSLKLHDNLKSEGYDLPEYDAFLGDMGLNQKKKDIPIPTLSEILQEPSKESSTVKPPLQSTEEKPKDRETTAVGDVLRSLKSGSQRALGGITGTPYFLSSTVLGSVVRPIAKAMGATDEEANIALTSVLMSNPTGVGALGGKDIQDKLINKAKKTEEKMMPIEGSIWQNLKAGEVGKAGELLGRGVAQSIPYLAMTAATAGGGTTAVLSTIGATSAAQQYAETEGQKEPKRLLNAWMYGGFEAAGELVTAGLLRGVGKAFSKGIVKKVDDSFVKAASKELGKAFGLEGSSEAMTQLGQNFTDIVTGVDPNRSLLDGVLDAALIGGFSGGGIGSASIGASVLGRTLASDKEVAQVENNVQQQGTLIDQIESTDSDPVKTALEKRLRTLRYEADKIMDKNYELAKELSPEQHARVAELYSVWNTLQAKIDNKEIISEQEITTTENTIEGIKEEIQSIREAKIAELGELKGEEVKYKIGDKTFKTTEEVESWLDKNYVKQGLDPVWHEPTEKLIDSWVKKNKEKIDQAQVTKKKVKIPEAPVSPVPVPKTPFIEINSQNISEIQNNVLTSLKEKNAPPEEVAETQRNLDLIKQSVDERSQREKSTDDLAETGAGVTGQISEILPGEVEGDGGTYEGLLGRRREGNRTPKLSPEDQVSQVAAPNGEKSNLSPENHAFVRTPEFKAKFGDWQKGEGSLVLDRNGEPLLVYSGKGKYHPEGIDPAKTDNKKLFFTGDKGLATLYAQIGGKQPVVYIGFVALSEQDLADKGSQINKFHDNQQEYLVSRKDQFIPVGVEEVPKIRKSKTEVQPVQKTETFTAPEQAPKVEQVPTTLKTKDDISAYASIKAEEKPEEKGRWDKMSAITGRVMDVLSKIAPDTEIVMLENDEAVNAELTKLGEDPGDLYNGWYHQGKIYLNAARFEESTPIHEAIHPIANVLRQLNPDKFSKWAKEAGKTKILVDGKKTTYFDYLNATGQAQEITEDEAVVTFLEDFIGGKIDYDKVNKTSVVEAVKQMLTDLLTYFGIDPKTLLGADISLDNIDDLTELSKALLKAFEEGRAVTTARTEVSPKVGPIEAGGVQFLNGTAADYPITEGVQGASQKSIALPDGRKVGGMNMPEVVNGFYSPIEKRLLDFKQEKASVNKWKEIIGKGDEATFTGVSQWLSQLKPDQTLTKAEISQFMKDNRIEVVEVEKGDVYIPSESEIDDFLDQRSYDGFDDQEDPITREEARDALIDQRNEQISSEPGDPDTKFHQYQLPGEKENYKEVLVTLPRKKTPIEQKASKELDQLFSIPSSERTEEQRSRILALQDEIQAQSTSVFKSSHFDEPNILVHLRMNTRTDSEGKKVLFLEEVQSDYGQSIKKEGVITKSYVFTYLDNNGDIQNKEFKTWAEADTFRNTISSDKHSSAGIREMTEGKYPPAPFVTDTNSWTKLGLKVALKEAIKQGVDRIAWTTGEQQNERYDLSKQVDEIKWEIVSTKEVNGKENIYNIIPVKDGLDYGGEGAIRNFVESLSNVPESKLPDIIGKEATDKIISTRPAPNMSTSLNKQPRFGVLRGNDLKVGGKGMIGFYGSPQESKLGIVGNIAKSLFKQEPKTTNMGTKDVNVDEKYIRTNGVPIDYNKARNFNFDGNDLLYAQKEGGALHRIHSFFELGLAKDETLLQVSPETTVKQHSIDITPALKEEVKRGLPQFQKAMPGKVLVPKSWDIDEDGKNFIFYHYGNIKGDTIDPKFHGKNAYTSDKRTNKVSYYYVKEGQRERMVGGKPYVVTVPKTKVYPFNEDPLHFYEKAKAQWEKENPGMAFGPVHQIDAMNPMIAKAGYDMVVAKWDAFPLRAESTKPLKFDKKRTEEFGKRQEGGKLGEIKDQMANDISGKASRNPDLSVFYSGGIDAVLADPKLRKLVDKKLLAKYESLTSQKKVQPSIDRKALINNVTEEVTRLKALPKEAEDGATLNLDGTKYTGGGLATPVSSLNLSQAELTPEAVADFIEANSGKLSDAVKPGLYKFPNDTKMSIDLNIVAPKKHMDVAIEFGRLAGQKSLFNLDTFEYVETGATGENPIQFTDEEFKEIGESLSKGKLPEAVSQLQTQKAGQGKRVVIEEAPVGKEREKGLYKRLMESSTPSKAFKEEIEAQGLTYKVLNNEVTRANIDYTIAQLGMEEAWKQTKDKGSALNGATRSGLSERLIVHYDRLATDAEKAGFPEEAKEYRDKALEIADWKDEYGRDAGRFNQYSGSDESTKLLSPQTTIIRAKRDIEKQRTKQVEKNKEDIKEKRDALRKANKDTLEELLGSDAYQKIKAKLDEAKKETKRNAPEVIKAKIKREQTYRATQWDLFKKAGGGTLSSTAVGLTKEQIEAIGNIVASYVREGVYRTEDLVRRLQEDWFTYTGEKLDAKEAEKLIPSKIITQAVKEKIKELGIDVNKIVRQHYTVQDATGRTLADKLAEEAGLTPKEAETFAKAIQNEFNRIATEKKRKILLTGITARAKRLTNPKVAKKEWERLVELTNLGAFSNAEFSEAYADIWGFPKLTEENLKEMDRLARDIQTKEGFKKDEAVRDYLNYMANLPGLDLGEVALGWWYASILSGERTQFKNFLGNLINTAFEASIGTLYNVVKGDFKTAQAMWAGLLSTPTIAEAMTEARYTWTSGYSPVRNNKIEAAQYLERYKLKGGWWNPVNYAKYVGRFMSATDVFFYVGLKEMRAHELAMREARKQNAEATEPTASDWAKAAEILYGTKQRKAEAELQAQDEGLTGLAYKKRVWELMEASRGEELITETNSFASRGTYNYRPEGGLGMITEAIGHTVGDMQVNIKNPFSGKKYTVRFGKFFVPFTRIIANVGNTALDYTPIGAVRAGTGAIGTERKPAYYRKLTSEERARTLIKSVVGVSAATILWLLSEPPDDDDKEPVIQITANGTGDYAKNQELKNSPNGWQQYSIKMGEKWYSYQYTPLFLMLAPLGFVRDTEAYKKDKTTTMSAWNMLTAGSTMFLSALSDMTALSTTSGLLEAISSGDLREAEKFWKRMASSTVKGFAYPKAIEQTKQMIDDFNNNPLHYSSSLAGKMIKDMPIIQNRFPIQYNALGEEVSFDAVQMMEKSTGTPLTKFIVDNGAFIGTPSQKDKFCVIYDDKLGIERGMNDEEYMKFVQVSGTEIKNRIITELMPRTDLEPEQIRNEVNNIKSEVRKQVKATLFGWLDIKKDHPQDWNTMVSVNAVPIPESLVEIEIDDKKTRLDKAQTEEFNKKAVEYYRQYVIDYLKDKEVVKADQDIDPETGDSYFRGYIRDYWSEAKDNAKADMVDELMKNK